MDTLKKLFPLSFCASDLSKLILISLIYVVVGTVLLFVIGLLAKIPIIGIPFSLLATLIEIYIAFGIVILLLDYFKVLK
ncbi:MAG: hypothetical protein J6K26_02600 [Lachnospiraceae bacterium]|nr:hypothetical protein [Lachnospiraceae bacterium]